MLAGLIILGWIPPNELGIWQSLLIIQAYAGIVQGGITHGLNRELPFRIGGGAASAQSLASTAQTFSVIGASMLFLVGLISFFISDDPLIRYSLPVVFFVSAAGTYYNYLAVTFRADQAFERLAKIYLMTAALNLITLPLVYIVGYFGIPLRIFSISVVQLVAIHVYRPFHVPLKIDWYDFFTLAKVGVPLFGFGYMISVAYTFPKTILLIGSGTEMVGLFAPAAAIFSVITLLPRSISQYIYAKMSYRFGQTGDPVSLWPYAWKSSLGVLALSSPIVLLSSITFPWFVVEFYPKYAESTPAIAWISISGAFLGSSMFSSAMNSLKAWKWITVYTLSMVVLCFALPFAFYIALPRHPLVNVSAGFALAGAISFVIGLGCAFRATHPPVKEQAPFIQDVITEEGSSI